MHFSLIFLQKVHCKWSDWEEGECSKECGEGTQTNTRTKLVEEAHGGTCSGETTEVVECMVKECPGKFLIRNYDQDHRLHDILIFVWCMDL